MVDNFETARATTTGMYNVREIFHITEVNPNRLYLCNRY